MDDLPPLPVGKLPADLLARLLRHAPRADARVLVGAGIGVDAAVIDFSPWPLVAKSDPITFATDEIGWYAVHVNANDVAVMGGTPRWFLATLLIPQGAPVSLPEEIFIQVADACRALRVDLVGGHTEITAGLPRPIVVGHMLGEVVNRRVVTSAGARPRDALLLARGIPIEATALLARECGDALRAAGLTEADVARAAAFLRDPGISVVAEARLALERARVTAMHDPTEGGLATGLRELAMAASVGLRVYELRILVPDLSARICAALSLDPLGCIASGALLLTCHPDDAPSLLAAYQEQGVPAAQIGEVLPADQGLRIVRKEGTETDLPAFPRDEIARLFEGE
ncbi:MAG: AIR synthase [Armatimonadetes bacterium]|nr:AIR synthase [Armatimonadota bacterium]